MRKPELEYSKKIYDANCEQLVEMVRTDANVILNTGRNKNYYRRESIIAILLFLRNQPIMDSNNPDFMAYWNETHKYFRGLSKEKLQKVFEAYGIILSKGETTNIKNAELVSIIVKLNYIYAYWTH